MSNRFKLAGAIVGVGAVVALGTLAIGLDRGGPGASTLAGSGDAPSNTMYAPPSVKNMNVGATAATTTTPPAVPPIEVASPTVKAGH